MKTKLQFQTFLKADPNTNSICSLNFTSHEHVNITELSNPLFLEPLNQWQIISIAVQQLFPKIVIRLCFFFIDFLKIQFFVQL